MILSLLENSSHPFFKYLMKVFKRGKGNDPDYYDYNLQENYLLKEIKFYEYRKLCEIKNC